MKHSHWSTVITLPVLSIGWQAITITGFIAVFETCRSLQLLIERTHSLPAQAVTVDYRNYTALSQATIVPLQGLYLLSPFKLLRQSLS
jgi:hypothetical protein